MRRWKKRAILAATAALFAAPLLAPRPAAARAAHHHHAHHPRHAAASPGGSAAMGEPADDATNLGPTAPGFSAIVINAASGAVLTENGADIPRYPASLTKLMTLDLAFQALRDGRMTLDTEIPVSDHAASVEPVKLGLPAGSTISVRDAILAMTTMSANDAATALGEYLGGGSEYRCAQMMTLRAHALGMAQTQFYNASGLPNPGQITTARDLALLARDLVTNFQQNQPFFEVQKFGFRGRTIYSNDGMLKTYPGAMGMKTGYTFLARHNLVTAAQRNGVTLIGVTLHEDSWGSTYTQMTALLDSGFGNPVPGSSVMLASRQPQPGAQKLASAAPNPAPPSYSPPDIPLPAPPSGVAALFPSADAATLRPATPRTKVAGGAARDLVPGWTAQLGSFAQMKSAKLQAINVHKLRGVGVARVARLNRHGKILWAAQLAGLTHTSASATCRLMATRGDSCLVIAPPNDHLAMREVSAG